MDPGHRGRRTHEPRRTTPEYVRRLPRGSRVAWPRSMQVSAMSWGQPDPRPGRRWWPRQAATGSARCSGQGRPTASPGPLRAGVDPQRVPRRHKPDLPPSAPSRRRHLWMTHLEKTHPEARRRIQRGRISKTAHPERTHQQDGASRRRRICETAIVSVIAVVPVIAIVGPTATGKSELALTLAQRLDGEIVNADAMQLYRGMDIGTAKLPIEARRGIAHHQLDVLDVCQEASVAAYQREARLDVAGIRSRRRRPILVGGSGLYVRAALDRLEIPPTDPAVRARLEGELAVEGIAAMHTRLRKADPVAARAIQPKNERRVVRALEVIELTGRPFSATLPTREYELPTITIGLCVPRPELDARIAARVHQMWDAGLLE